MSSKLKLQARRRAERFGDLDALLSAALKEQLSHRAPTKRLKGINMAVHESYANPENWTQTGVVQVIYTNEQTGEQVTIGTFQEFTHRWQEGRKLERIPNTDGVSSLDFKFRFERSNDPFLVGPPAPVFIPVAKGDVLAQMAIRSYLARTKEQSLDDFLGGDHKSKVDAQKLLNQLKAMGVEKLR
jgi:hypothetical protein